MTNDVVTIVCYNQKNHMERKAANILPRLSYAQRVANGKGMVKSLLSYKQVICYVRTTKGEQR